MKMYILRYEQMYNDGSYASGTYTLAFKDIESARAELDEIKWDEMCWYEDNGYDMDKIKRWTSNLMQGDGFMIDLSGEYTKWIIEDVEVK